MNRETVSIEISIIALLVICVAHVVFIIRIRNGQIRPNASSWGSWTFAALVNTLSYNAMSQDIVVAAWTFMTFAMCAIVFIYTLAKKGFSKMTMADWLLSSLSVVAVFVLYFRHDAKTASLILVGASAIPFLPTIFGLMSNPRNENYLPWLILNLGYSMVMINIIMRWKGEWGNLAMPILFIVGNSCIIFLSSGKRKQRRGSCKMNGINDTTKNALAMSFCLDLRRYELTQKEAEEVFLVALSLHVPDREKTVFVSELIHIVHDDNPDAPELQCGIYNCPFWQQLPSPSYPWPRCMLPGKENGGHHDFLGSVEQWLRSYSVGADGKKYLTIAPERSRNCMAVRPLTTKMEGGKTE